MGTPYNVISMIIFPLGFEQLSNMSSKTFLVVPNETLSYFNNETVTNAEHLPEDLRISTNI